MVDQTAAREMLEDIRTLRLLLQIADERLDIWQQRLEELIASDGPGGDDPPELDEQIPGDACGIEPDIVDV